MDIIRCRPGDEDFRYFSETLNNIYSPGDIRFRQHENLNSEFLYSCLIVLLNEKPVGRLAVYKNPSLQYKGKEAACIGNYECIKDSEVAAFLLQEAENTIRSFLFEYIVGPMNGATWDNYRFSTHHNFQNFLLEPYHPLYYNHQFQENGFSVISTYSSSIDKTADYDLSEVMNREKELHKSGVTIRSIKIDDLENELRLLYPFISKEFSNNFLFTPISWGSFRDKYMGAKNIINPDYVLIAENIKKEIIGFIFSYQDLFNTAEKSLVVKTVARNASPEWTGLGKVLGNKVVSLARSRGFTSVVHAFMIGEAVSTGLSNTFSGKVYKNYNLYGKAL